MDCLEQVQSFGRMVEGVHWDRDPILWPGEASLYTWIVYVLGIRRMRERCKTVHNTDSGIETTQCTCHTQFHFDIFVGAYMHIWAKRLQCAYVCVWVCVELIRLLVVVCESLVLQPEHGNSNSRNSRWYCWWVFDGLKGVVGGWLNDDCSESI